VKRCSVATCRSPATMATMPRERKYTYSKGCSMVRESRGCSSARRRSAVREKKTSSPLSPSTIAKSPDEKTTRCSLRT